MPLPTILFCSDPLGGPRPDETFAGEHAAATRAGFPTALVDHEALVRGETGRALRRVREGAGALLYRGWMMRPEAYRALHDALVARGFAPLTDPDAYAEAHLLPLAYPLLRDWTAETAWSEGQDLDRAHAAACSLGPGPLFLKDFVKSAKHRFREACLIEDTRDRARFDEVCRALIEDRGALFERGLVFRKLLPLRTRGTSMLGAPIHEEIRLFFVRGERLPLGELPADLPLGELREVARRFRSPFVTIDVARGDDRWFVIEAGDGGVSGIPPALDDGDFYAALAGALGAP